MQNDQPALSYAAEQVRRHDRERFVTALFAPPDRREALMALYAFNVEVARVRESVREPMAGLVRLQWWRDVIGAARRGEPIPHHPVAEPLARLVREHDLPEEPFDLLLAAREQDLSPEPPHDLEAAEIYARHTSSGLGVLALRVLGGLGEGEAVAAGHVGVAWALVGQIRALPFTLSTGRLTWPDKVLRAAGTEPSAVLSGQAPKAAIAAAARLMGERAGQHLKLARRHKVARAALPALLPATLAAGHLARLAKAGWDPFDMRVATPRPMPLRLAMAHLLGKF